LTRRIDHRKMRAVKIVIFAFLAFAALPALASPSGVVISGFQLRGPQGGNDEYVEIRNVGAASVDIGGWRLQGCQSTAPGTAGTRATVPGGVLLAPGQYFLFTNGASSGYSGSVAGDATYTTGIADFAPSGYAGMQLVDPASVKQDGVGAPSSPCREGTGFATPTVNGPSNAYLRTRDTDDNVADFSGPQASDPHNSGSNVAVCPNDGVRIFAIQGRGHVSPLNAQCVVNVPGIVTQVLDNGFFMQDGDGDGDVATSDGIFVFVSSPPAVVAGQQVKVKGTVAEHRPGSSFGATNCPASANACNLTLTEIIAPTVTPASGLFANTAIAPVLLGTSGRVPPNQVLDNDTAGSVEVAAQTSYDPAQDGIDFYESLEGMRVRVDNARVLGPSSAFGEIWLLGDNATAASGVNARGGVSLVESGGVVDFNPERIQIDVRRLAATGVQVRVGDTVPTVVGALTYDLGNFRILPDSLPTFTSGGLAPAISGVSSGDDRLRVASYNVENLDANDDDNCGGSPDRDVADGRFARLAQHIVVALGAPDVVGLQEVQDDSGCADDGTVNAGTTLGTLLQAIAGAGGPGYAHVQISPANNADGGAPGANIRQAILYNPSRIAFVPGTQGTGNAGTASIPSLDAQGRLQLSHSPGRIDPANSAWASSRKPLVATFDFNGRRVLVIVNHFNSKGGDAPLFGRLRPPPLGSEPQRLQQAQSENEFVRQVLALDASARIVSLGDFNDFEFSAPIRTLTGQGVGTPVLTGLAGLLLPAPERYSYIFQGNSQQLDHIFVSSALVAGAQFQVVHLNAEFADGVSDHDPLIASLRIPSATSGAPVLAGAASRKVHGIAGMHDVVLSLATTSPTTEPRSGGAGGNHSVVFTFDRVVTGGNVSVTAGSASAGAPTFDGNEMIVPLSGVANEQYVTVAVTNVTAADGGSGGGGSVRLGFLLGDVSQNRVVTVSDLAQVNGQIAQSVTPANFLKDVNATGTLTVADKGIANTQITKALPIP
jgi:predicted extracellular nuclease